MESVVALFRDTAQAEAALRRLVEGGVDREHLAFSMLDPVRQEEIARETGVQHEDGAPGGSGVIFRASWLGMLAGIALAVPTWLLMLVFPETRVFQVGGLYGIMFGALAGLGLGATFGALAGGDHGDYVKLLQRMGVPESVALGYYDALKRGEILVIARDQDLERADEVAQILQAAGAVEVGEATGGGRLHSERAPYSEGRHR